MSNAAVTVAIPCLNAVRWIGQAVESALAQVGSAVRVIVADNGSQDGSLVVLRGFGERITLVECEKKGANAARNLALSLADTEWIQFLDADDYLLRPKIASQLAAAMSHPAADAIYSPVWIEDAATGRREMSPIDGRLDRFGQWISWQLPQTGGVLWRRESLQRLGGWNEAMPCCQEHELYLRALKADLFFHFSPEPHAVYRIWSEETLCRRDPGRTIEVRTALTEDLRAWMTGRNLWMPVHRRLAGRAFFEMARTLAKTDMERAVAYHDAKAAAGLIHPAGPAAPWLYRFCYRAFGFRRAEKIAKALRKERP